MKMKIKIRTIFLVIFYTTGVYTLHANVVDSTKLQQLKFGMIKTAVVFYATDDSLHLGKPAPVCDTAKTTEGLILSAKTLTGVENRIREFDNMAVINKQSLEQLKAKIIDRIDAKPHRKTLEGYGVFVKGLEDMVRSAQELPASPPVEQKVDTTTKKPLVNNIMEDPDKPGDFLGLNSGNIIAIVLSLIAILFSYVFSRKPKQKHNTLSSASGGYDASRDNGTNDFLYEQLKNRQHTTEDRIDSLEHQLRRLAFAEEGNKAPEHLLPGITVEKQVANVIKYAKTADGNAFDVNTLSDRQDNKKIYELTIEELGKGTFKVTTNREAQLFALEDPNNYLRGACDYSSLPSSYNSTIITASPGKIELNGNKWCITKPAEIDFT